MQRDTKTDDFLVSTVTDSPHGRLMQIIIELLGKAEVTFTPVFGVDHRWSFQLKVSHYQEPRVIHDKITNTVIINPDMRAYTGRGPEELENILAESATNLDEPHANLMPNVCNIPFNYLLLDSMLLIQRRFL